MLCRCGSLIAITGNDPFSFCPTICQHGFHLIFSFKWHTDPRKKMFGHRPLPTLLICEFVSFRLSLFFWETRSFACHLHIADSVTRAHEFALKWIKCAEEEEEKEKEMKEKEKWVGHIPWALAAGLPFSCCLRRVPLLHLSAASSCLVNETWFTDLFPSTRQRQQVTGMFLSAIFCFI